MKRWLVKSDPGDYAAADLARDRVTPWDGVRNPQAVNNLGAMRPGDEVLIYHSGKERATVATAKVASEPRDDPDDPKSVLVDFAFDAWLKQPVTLRTIKSDSAFEDFALVKQSRLSVMPVTAAQWKRILKLAGGTQADPTE